ncbi:uncharacterized protein TRIADDRAFT_19863 [Trichoplax adhaerens]|uniref:Major facilitator superfamily (MFS) profile domain-containing protein n=1 Tax=Trichoplax adhaerens TaxID=10228 RepID=B3RIU1_TRIAD|nr:hypothetical protein TRIADDRAFT_19863 [Trichoplax adhaerens]EDV28447.1 hypothetical protein TRIADDRAFT_19863 [Trichoplax adhaerens]|eukprot:XP_002107649.1 hypothetical protein TRIADDRAFT_19863 [Trichoplax adhaerens]
MATDSINLRQPSSATEQDNDSDFNDRTKLLSDSQEINSANGSTHHEGGKSNRRLTVDDIAESLNCGLFQYLCNFVCGLCFIAEGLIIQSISIIAMSACDLNINPHNRTWLSMSLLIGIVVSCAFWGRLGDSFGRRRVLLLALFINITFTLLSAFSYNYQMLIIMAFFNGFGTGGVLPVALAYVIEFFPRKYRGMAGFSANAYWSFGNIYAAVMALLIITRSIAIPIGNIVLTGWRIFTIVCAIPPLIALISLAFMPNSPRFLIKQGKREKTLSVINRIHRINSYCSNKHRNQSLRIKLADLPTMSDILNDIDKDEGKASCSCWSRIVQFMRQYAILYSLKWRKRTLLMTAVWFLFCLCTYGFWLWLPTYFSLYAHGHGHKCLRPVILNRTRYHMNVLNQSLSCIENTRNTAIYRNLFLTTLSTLLAELIFIPIINISGRKLLFSGLALATGVIMLSIWLTNTSTGVLVFSCLFTGISGAAWPVLNVWTSELYPTQLRSTSNGYLNLWARIGAIIGTTTFGLLLQVSCKLPIIIVGIICLLSAILAIFLPDTSKVDID